MSKVKWWQIWKIEWWRILIESKWARAIVLAGSVLFGWRLLNSDIPDYLLSCIYKDENGNIPFLFAQLLATLPTVAFLWIFRTYDTRQQIDTSNAQLQQSNFISGVNKLISDDQLKISVGTKILLETSKITNAFDEQIRLAFIRRLQKLPAGMSAQPSVNPHDKKSLSILNNRISYTKHIFEWLVDHPELGNNINLNDPGFIYYEIRLIMDAGADDKMQEISLKQIQKVLDMTKREGL